MLWTSGAFGQTAPCGDRKHIERKLNKVFKEFVIGSGVANNGLMMEVYVSEEGTFTLTFTGPESTCIMATGKGWIFILPSVEELEL
jgi:hypothetical protein